MPWIKNIVSNPITDQVLIKFSVYTGGTPTNVIGLTGIYVASTATVQIGVRRKNNAENITYDVWRIVCPANDTRYFTMANDPLVVYIGLPEAGALEKVEVYNVAGISGTVFIAVQIFGGQAEIEVGSVY